MIVFALQPDDTGLIQINDNEGNPVVSEAFEVLSFNLVRDDALAICRERNIDTRTVIDPRFAKKLTELRYEVLDAAGILEQFI